MGGPEEVVRLVKNTLSLREGPFPQDLLRSVPAGDLKYGHVVLLHPSAELPVDKSGDVPE